MMQIREEKPSVPVVHVDVDIEDLVPIFLQNRHRDVEAMVHACGQRDFETVRILGHNMKGAGAGYGFDLVTDIGQSLERSATLQDHEAILKLVRDLSEYLEVVEVVIL